MSRWGNRGPNQAGLAMRLLAPDSGTLIRGIEAVFHIAARARLASIWRRGANETNDWMN